MDKKKIVIIALIVIILASVITNIYILTNNNTDEEFKIEGIEPVENKEILKDTDVDGLSITNVSLLTRDGVSSYKAKVTNTTNNKIKIDKLYVVFYKDEEENKILALSNVTINSNDSTYVSIISEIDLSKTTKIKYVIE